jgi:hypothetical protein
MSFKFKLGDIIVPTLAREMGASAEPSEVTAIQLGGYIQIQPIGTTHRHLVESKYYERLKKETVKPDS